MRALYASFQFQFCAALFRAFFILSLSLFRLLLQFSREQLLRAQLYVQLSFWLSFLLLPEPSPRMQSPAAAFYLPQYVFIRILFLPAQLYILALEQFSRNWKIKSDLSTYLFYRNLKIYHVFFYVSFQMLYFIDLRFPSAIIYFQLQVSLLRVLG
jgi:hypothetical protein